MIKLRSLRNALVLIWSTSDVFLLQDVRKYLLWSKLTGKFTIALFLKTVGNYNKDILQYL